MTDAEELQLYRTLIETARINTVKSMDIQSGGMLKIVLDEQVPFSITRFRNVEYICIPSKEIRQCKKL
jgi:hypothetical protein